MTKSRPRPLRAARSSTTSVVERPDQPARQPPATAQQTSGAGQGRSVRSQVGCAVQEAAEAVDHISPSTHQTAHPPSSGPTKQSTHNGAHRPTSHSPRSSPAQQPSAKPTIHEGAHSPSSPPAEQPVRQSSRSLDDPQTGSSGSSAIRQSSSDRWLDRSAGQQLRQPPNHLRPADQPIRRPKLGHPPTGLRPTDQPVHWPAALRNRQPTSDRRINGLQAVAQPSANPPPIRWPASLHNRQSPPTGEATDPHAEAQLSANPPPACGLAHPQAGPPAALPSANPLRRTGPPAAHPVPRPPPHHPGGLGRALACPVVYEGKTMGLRRSR
ncbi:hypothetical protein Actkin_04445 [Actinokineospora sp. UTMC 2448]|nr:hypothetical protein Actkin_04445 [Actinokineospora sp. UTMC 2448]